MIVRITVSDEIVTGLLTSGARHPAVRCVSGLPPHAKLVDAHARAGSGTLELCFEVDDGHNALMQVHPEFIADGGS